MLNQSMFQKDKIVESKQTHEEEQKSNPKKPRLRHEEYFPKALELFQKTNRIPFKPLQSCDDKSSIQSIFNSDIKRVLEGLSILMQIQDFKQIQEQIRKQILQRLLDIITTHNQKHDCKYMAIICTKNLIYMASCSNNKIYFPYYNDITNICLEILRVTGGIEADMLNEVLLTLNVIAKSYPQQPKKINLLNNNNFMNTLVGKCKRSNNLNTNLQLNAISLFYNVIYYQGLDINHIKKYSIVNMFYKLFVEFNETHQEIFRFALQIFTSISNKFDLYAEDVLDENMVILILKLLINEKKNVDKYRIDLGNKGATQLLNKNGIIKYCQRFIADLCYWDYCINGCNTQIDGMLKFKFNNCNYLEVIETLLQYGDQYHQINTMRSLEWMLCDEKRIRNIMMYNDGSIIKLILKHITDMQVVHTIRSGLNSKSLSLQACQVLFREALYNCNAESVNRKQKSIINTNV